MGDDGSGASGSAAGLKLRFAQAPGPFCQGSLVAALPLYKERIGADAGVYADKRPGNNVPHDLQYELVRQLLTDLQGRPGGAGLSWLVLCTLLASRYRKWSRQTVRC